MADACAVLASAAPVERLQSAHVQSTCLLYWLHELTFFAGMLQVMPPKLFNYDFNERPP